MKKPTIGCLTRLRELEAAATPGPWEYEHIRDAGAFHYEYVIAEAEPDGVAQAQHEPDARLIVAMRNHWRALLDVASETKRRHLDMCSGYDDPISGSRKCTLCAALTRLDSVGGGS